MFCVVQLRESSKCIFLQLSRAHRGPVARIPKGQWVNKRENPDVTEGIRWSNTWGWSRTCWRQWALPILEAFIWRFLMERFRTEWGYFFPPYFIRHLSVVVVILLPVYIFERYWFSTKYDLSRLCRCTFWNDNFLRQIFAEPEQHQLNRERQKTQSALSPRAWRTR